MTVDVLELAKVLAILAGGATVIFKIIKPITAVLKKIEKLERHQNETYMQTLRLVIMSEEMPLEERIATGDKYITNGGNGAIKRFYEDDLLPRLHHRK